MMRTSDWTSKVVDDIMGFLDSFLQLSINISPMARSLKSDLKLVLGQSND